MGRQRARSQVKRTFIPEEYLRMLGNRIRLALQEEHIRHDSAKRRRTRFSTERVCRATGIPFNAMAAYMEGKRQPGILDMRAICEFSEVRFEEIMSVIPSRKQLDDLYEETKKRVMEEAKRRREAAEELDDEEAGWDDH